MGNNGDLKPSKSEKSSSPPPQDTNKIHVHPGWGTMQVFYGPRVALPPYYNPALASGHTHHGSHRPTPYMWCPPQHLMPPYGMPYAAIYSPGGVYAHPAVPLDLHLVQGVTSSPAVAPPLSMDMPTKSTGNSDQGLMKKLKKLDGLAMSIGNSNPESAEEGSERLLLHSTETTEGSSDGSNANMDRADQPGTKRSREETPTYGTGGKTETRDSCAPVESAYTAAPSKVLLGETFSPITIPGKLLGPATVPQPGSVMPPEPWLQNDRELKRERRKQSNRESARRSRLRKQAEIEELDKKVKSLTAENVALKSEINQLAENSEKLRLENSAYMEKLKNTLGVGTNALNIMAEAVVTKEYEKKLGKKVHQLLDANPMADAVVAV